MGSCTSKRSKRDDLYEPLLAENEKEAVSTLLRQLEGNPDNPRLLGEALGSLTILSNSNNLELQRSAALTFAEVTEKVRTPVKRDVLDPLFYLLQSPDSEVQRASSAAIGNLAVNDENKALIVEMGGLAHLVRLLLSPFPEVQCNACGCLTNLATSAANKVKIANSGAVPLLVRLGNSDDLRVQRNFTGALLNLTHAAENRSLLVSEGVLPVFVKLLRSQDQDIQYYCAAALSNLAVDANNRQEMKKIDDNLTSGLIYLMQCPSTKVQCQAALAVRNLASDEHFQVHVVQKGGLQSLLKLLRSSHPHVVVASVAAVRNISIHDSNEEKMVAAGFLSPLLTLTGFMSTNSTANTAALSISDEIRCHAIATLRNISTSDSLKIAVADAGGIEKFLTVINEASPVVQAELAKAIVVLAVNDVIKTRLEGTSICAVLVRLMDSPNSEVQANCAAALGSLSSSQLFSKHFVTHWPKVLAYLTRFLQSRDSTMIHIALWTLSQLSAFSDVLVEIKKSPELAEKIEQAKKQTDNPEISKLGEELIMNVFLNATEYV